jgi:FkbH-like protein
MSNEPSLYWLPDDDRWTARLTEADSLPDEQRAWNALVAVARTRADFVRTKRIDLAMRKRFAAHPPASLATQAVRLALLGSCTVSHLAPAIRVAALRRGMWARIYEAPYGQYRQELLDPSSAIHQFDPTEILFSFDARHLIGLAGDLGDDRAVTRVLDGIRQSWTIARQQFRCGIIQQTVMPIFDQLYGSNEHRFADSRFSVVHRLNGVLREAAGRDSVDLLPIDSIVARYGLMACYDPSFWHRAKQEISPAIAPLYGDYVARIVAARAGRSHKCVALDLDNTLWGGIVGDDGLEGIVIGQGSAVGEAYADFQRYIVELSRRGIIVAICSKNEESIAWSAFKSHPEMVLRASDISILVANWNDKVANLRRIASSLNIGLDSMVFVDDNPAERALVRRELLEVAVPELPDDPALFSQCLADAGYFETLTLSEEDRARTEQYRANQARSALGEEAADVPAFLKSLEMRLLWRKFDRVGLVRITQLINKTSQFNLTTRRYTEREVAAIIADPNYLALQFRLLDKFGDNGIIAILIARAVARDEMEIDSWLMSCRVFARQVEYAAMNVLAEEASLRGARHLIGEYLPTAKNAIVENLYPAMGFVEMAMSSPARRRFSLELNSFKPFETFIEVQHSGDGTS